MEYQRANPAGTRLSGPSQTSSNHGESTETTVATMPGPNGSDGDTTFMDFRSENFDDPTTETNPGVDPSVSGDFSDEGGEPSYDEASELGNEHGGGAGVKSSILSLDSVFQ